MNTRRALAFLLTVCLTVPTFSIAESDGPSEVDYQTEIEIVESSEELDTVEYAVDEEIADFTDDTAEIDNKDEEEEEISDEELSQGNGTASAAMGAYVRANTDTAFYSTIAMDEQIGIMKEDEIVYSTASEAEDILCLSFVPADTNEIVICYADAESFSALGEAKTQVYLDKMSDKCMIDLKGHIIPTANAVMLNGSAEAAQEDNDGASLSVEENADLAESDEEALENSGIPEALDAKADSNYDLSITYNEQIAAGKVLLKWQPVTGAHSYKITGGSKTVVTTLTTASVTKLPEGCTTLQVTACSDKKGKTAMSQFAVVEAIVENWDWAAAPQGLKATQEDALEPVVTLRWNAVTSANGYEISKNKKAVIATSEDGSGHAKIKTTTGTQTYYIRPYRNAKDGTKIYGAWSKAVKFTVKVKWMTTKPKIKTVSQIGEHIVKLTWNEVTDADGYYVYEVVKKKYTQVSETTDAQAVISDVTYGKHSYAVSAFRLNSEGEFDQGVYSAAKAIKTAVLWSKAPTLTVRQSGDSTAMLSWKAKGDIASYNVYGKVGKNYVLLANVTDMSYETDPTTFAMTIGKSYSFKVVPLNSAKKAGTASKIKTVKMIASWQVAPVLSAFQSGEDTATLSWSVAGAAESYRIYAVSGKTKITSTVNVGDVSYTGQRISYTMSGLSKKTYTFTVEPIQKSGKKTVTGKKSNTVSVTIGNYAASNDIGIDERLNCLEESLELIENPVNQGSLENISLDLKQKSTEGITDTAKLTEIKEYNTAVKETQKYEDAYNGELLEVKNLLGDLASEMSALTFSEDGNVKLKADGLNFSLDSSVASGFSDDFEVVNIYSSGSTFSIEAISGGKTFYIVTNGSTVKITDKNTIKSSSKAVSADILVSKLDMSGMVQTLSGFISTVSDIINKIDLGLETLYQSAWNVDRAAAKIGVFLDTAGNISKLRIRWKGLGFVSSIFSIKSDIEDIKAIGSIKEHGHPTSSDLSIPRLAATASVINQHVVQAEMALATDVITGIISICTDITTFVCMVSAAWTGGASLAASLAFGVSVTALEGSLKQALLGIAVTISVEVAKAQVKSDEKTLHEVSVLKGCVTDKDTGKGIGGVTIECDDKSVTTDSNGNYNLSLALGEVKVTASKTDYKSGAKTTTVEDNKTNTLNFVLQAKKGNVIGTITDKDTGEIISNASIHCLDVLEMSGSDGAYTISLNEGRNTIQFSADGYESVSYTTDVVMGKDTTLNVSMEAKPGKLAGKITDSKDGSNLSGVKVSCGNKSTTTNSLGEYSLSVSAGEKTIEFTKAKYKSVTKSITIEADTTKNLNLSMEMDETGTITGKITDKDTGKALTGVSVTCGDKSAITGTDGTYNLEVSTGSYTIRYAMEKYETVEQFVLIESDVTTRLDISMKKGIGTITGKVTNKGNRKAISGVTVSCCDEKVITDTEGMYSIDVPVGKQTIEYTKEKYANLEMTVEVQNDANIELNVAMETTDAIFFGHYDQDGDTTNGAEPIEWRLLEDYGNGTYLLLSEYGLETKPYNNTYANVTWETCTLRSWLNGSFLNTAFTAEERKQLVTVTNQNPDNGYYGTEGGNATQDTVWLLSLDEVSKYFGVEYVYGQSDDLICYPTQTAKDNDVYTYNGACWWWLRSPGYVSDYAAGVISYGGVDTDGYDVRSTRDCVRPVVVLRLS